MIINIVIAAMTLVIALNGIFFQTKRNPDEPTHWKNSNSYGKLLFGLIILLAILNLFVDYGKNQEHKKEQESLLQSQKELKETNRHLLKVASVSGGYNATVIGVMIFNKLPNGDSIKKAIENAFLKCVEIELVASNKLGTYRGRIDGALHPQAFRYTNLTNLEENSQLRMHITYRSANSIYFEVRCSGLKILNDDKIQYAQMNNSNNNIEAIIEPSSWLRICHKDYGINRIYIDQVKIQELEVIDIRKEY